jgi:D-glycero-alpha-D-manno-heptose-7-phosphate kinase
LNHLLGEKYSKDDLIQLGANLEAQSIRMPTGKQDYYAAAFGGINCIWFGIDHPKVEPLELPAATLDQLSRQLILAYTGESRTSAVSNWNILKRYIDNAGSTAQQMKGIKAAASAMRDALLKGDLKRFGELLEEDWRNHKSLADGVTTPQIERMIAEAEKSGALASKMCGTGGGGCMITLVQEGRRAEVEMALQRSGATILNYAIDMGGVRIRKSR